MHRLLSSLFLSPSLSLSSLLPLSRGAPRRHHAIPGLFIINNNKNNFGAQQRERRRLLHVHVHVGPSLSPLSQQQQIKLSSKLQQQQHRCMMVSTEAGTNTNNNNKGDDNKKDAVTTSTSSHYENHSKEESYEDAYFYEPGEYMEHLINLCRNRLQIQIPISQEKADQKQIRKRKSPEEKPDQILIRKRCILDIGGGTGNFAKELIHQNDNSRIVVVDPFLIGDNNNNTDNYIDYSNPGSDIVSFIKAPAEDFLISQSTENFDDWRTTIINHKYDGYDQILLKEVIHHFQKKDRVGIFRGMKDGLRKQSNSKSTRNKQSRKSKSITTADLHSHSHSQPYPSILIITRPQIEIDYPLWSEAKDVWKQNQPSIEDIQQDLLEAGYTNIKWNVESYPCSITLNRWTDMIRSRFWSTFSNFSDLELEEACNEITAKAKAAKTKTINDNDNDDNDDNAIILRFEDRLIFLTAS